MLQGLQSSTVYNGEQQK